MLSGTWPSPLGRATDRVALYVALPLPAVWEAAVLFTGAVLEREFGCRAALLHPPHITLHPPLFPTVEPERVVEQLGRVARGLPAGSIGRLGVRSFAAGDGAPGQVVLALDPAWCRAAHEALLDGLGDCWDAADELTLRIWPLAHRGATFQPHVSLAIGDLPADPDLRRRLARRTAEIFDGLLEIGRAPEAYAPDRLWLIAYQNDWENAPFTVVAGPEIVGTVGLAQEGRP